MKVIDAVMSSGKSTYAIAKMKETKKPTLYITPFITECDRVSKATGVMTPKTGKGETRSKVVQACDTIEMGFSLVITHSLFLLLPPETVDLLSTYDLIIDETLTCCEHVAIAFSEIESMLRDEIVVVTEEFVGYKRLVINTPDRFKDTELLKFHHSRLAGNCDIILSDNNLLMMMLPARVFNDSSRITLLTYNFVGSDFDCYLKLRGVKYELFGLANGELCGYVKQDGSKFRHLVTVVDHKKLNEQKAPKRAERFTKRWYSNLSSDSLNEISKNVFNFFNNIAKTPSNRNLFTVFEMTSGKEHYVDQDGGMFSTDKCSSTIRDKIIRAPFKQVGTKPFRYDFGHLDFEKEVNMEAERKRMCWLPLNCRGTNLYGERTSVAYLVNLNLSPALVNFFKTTIGEAPDNDLFATNMMIQFIFRSAIRNGKPIKVYIPSLRMRHLFLTWLGYAKEELF